MSAAAEAGAASDAAPAEASVETRLGTIESVLSDLGATMKRMEAAPAGALSPTPQGAEAQAEVTRMVGEAIAAANAAGVESGSFRRGATLPSAVAVFGGKQDGGASPSIRSHSPTPTSVGSRRATTDSDEVAAQPTAADSGSGRGGEEKTDLVRARALPPPAPRARGTGGHAAARALLPHYPTPLVLRLTPPLLPAARRCSPKALAPPTAGASHCPGRPLPRFRDTMGLIPGHATPRTRTNHRAADGATPSPGRGLPQWG